MSYEGATKLSGLARGSLCLVTGMDSRDTVAVRLLHRIGIVEGELVRVLCCGDCMMLDCCGNRIAVRREIAHAVQVVLVEETMESCGDPALSATEPASAAV